MSFNPIEPVPVTLHIISVNLGLSTIFWITDGVFMGLFLQYLDPNFRLGSKALDVSPPYLSVAIKHHPLFLSSARTLFRRLWLRYVKTG